MASPGENAGHIAAGPSPNERGLPQPALDSAASEALDRALRLGDRARAIQLIDELFGARLFRFIYGLVRKADLADDLYQTTRARPMSGQQAR